MLPNLKSDYKTFSNKDFKVGDLIVYNISYDEAVAIHGEESLSAKFKNGNNAIWKITYMGEVGCFIEQYNNSKSVRKIIPYNCFNKVTKYIGETIKIKIT